MRRTALIVLRRRAALVGALAAATLAVVGGASAQAQTTITVDTTSNVVDFGGGQTVGDLPGPDGLTSLREAAIASTNTAGSETIAFDIPTTDLGFDGEEFVIHFEPASFQEFLTLGGDNTTLDATTQPGGFPVVLEGGDQALADGSFGLHITSAGTTVIGLTVRFYGFGIILQQQGATDVVITDSVLAGNRQGVRLGSSTGGLTITNSVIRNNIERGIEVRNTTEATVDANTITGNGSSGVSISGSDEVTVTGNQISENGDWGITFSGTTACPQAGDRGGIATGNTITGNTRAGVLVTFADRFTVSRNTIVDNTGLGIDLDGGKEDPFGVTRNDGNDNDCGGNQLMNYPEKMTAVDDGTATTVEGRLRFPDPASVTIELFANDAPDRSGHGEGQRFVGTATPDAQGNLTATLPAGLAGQWITATATDSAGNTSEFSQAVQVQAPGP